MKYYFPERRIFLNSVKDIKKYAKTLLYADWVSHIAVLFGFMVCILGLSFAGYASLALLNKYAHLTEVHYGLLSVFFTLFIGLPVIPLMYGLCVYAANTVGGHKPNILDLFYAFGSLRAFSRSYKLFFALVWRAIVVFAIPAACVYQAEVLLYEENFLFVSYYGYDVGYFVISVGLFLLFYAAFAVFARYAAAVYLTAENELLPVSVCFSAASFALSCHNGCHSYTRLMFSFLPLTILSVFTFGVLFLVYTAPLMLITCFLNAKTLTESSMLGLYFNVLFEKCHFPRPNTPLDL